MSSDTLLDEDPTSYAHADEPIGNVRQIYDGALYPDLAVNTFRNIDRLFPTRVVRRGNHIYELPTADEQLVNFKFMADGQEYDLYDYLAIGRVSGLLVLKKGKIAFEQYFLGNDKNTRWMSMSVAKSITAMLVGAAIKDGAIKSIGDNVANYLPQFVGTAYDGVSVEQLLQMTSGVAWNETYTDPASERRAMLEAQISQQPRKILELMGSLPRVATPGTKWNYSTGETHVAGALVKAATGKPVAEYLSEKIWATFGMESNASWWLESPDGLEVGGSGLSATLRDFGRFGLFMLNGGQVGKETILPRGWMEAASTPVEVSNTPDRAYGYMLWTLRNNAYAAIGIFGQFVYVRPDLNVVIAMWSAQPKPIGRSGINVYDFLPALSEAVP